MSGYQWNNCIANYGTEVPNFFQEYFQNKKKRCLLIGGAGFDPRSAEIVQDVSCILGKSLFALVIKEERSNPDPRLIKEANNNLEQLRSTCQNALVVEIIDIFSSDNAVVGGRNAIKTISKIDLENYTDVIIDMSALSIGIGFPIVLYLYEAAREINRKLNVHLTVVSNPIVDKLISSNPNDRISGIHGFHRHNLFGDNEKARLWVPQLSEKKQNELKMIHSQIKPHDTCPILPFPSEDPKKGDLVAWGLFSSIQSDFGGPLENEWGLDPKNFVYADERKPLDIYRTILRISDERNPVFETFGGSNIILSPVGSKIPAIGTLMAAIECKFPIVYVESLGYKVDWSHIQEVTPGNSNKTHIWLFGDAYFRDFDT